MCAVSPFHPNTKLTGRAEATLAYILQRLLFTATRMRGPVERLVRQQRTVTNSFLHVARVSLQPS